MNDALAVFDLDGTILDTLEDLRDSLNYALGAWGCPPRTTEEVRRFVGNGIRKLVERGVPADAGPALTERVYETFVPYYQAHCSIKTAPYPGIPELIARLRAQGVRCAVVSNKADPAVQALCSRYFPGCFDLAVGERPGIRRKPAPDSVNAVLAALDTPRERAVYIGDSEVDLATARNAGLDCILVEWGFRDRAFLQAQGGTVFVSSPEELLDRIVGQAQKSPGIGDSGACGAGDGNRTRAFSLGS